ncbi:hypothetical protein VOLCADRAFT_92393, partial [Volvox carteri f. nagariensis]
ARSAMPVFQLTSVRNGAVTGVSTRNVNALNSMSAGEEYVNRTKFKSALLVATGWKARTQDLEFCLGQSVPANAKLTVEHLHRMVVATSRDSTARLREVYQAFDASGLGFVRRDEAQRIFQDVAPTVRSSTFEEVFDALDTTRSGRVSCDDFMSALRLLLQ